MKTSQRMKVLAVWQPVNQSVQISRWIRVKQVITANILSTHEVVEYVIPSFSIVNVKLRHAIVTFGTSSEQVDVFFNESSGRMIHDRVPFSIQVENMCTVEVRTSCIYVRHVYSSLIVINLLLFNNDSIKVISYKEILA